MIFRTNSELDYVLNLNCNAFNPTINILYAGMGNLGFCVWGVCPQGWGQLPNLVPIYDFVKFSRKLHEIDGVCPEDLFFKI